MGSNRFFKFIGGFLAFGFTFLQGVDWIFTKYSIDNKYFNYILIILLIAFLLSIIILFISSRRVIKNISPAKTKKSRFIKIGNIVLTSLLLLLFVYFFRKSSSKDLLLDDLLPKISKAYDNGDTYYVFKNSIDLLKTYPENQILKSFLKKTSWTVNVDSDLENTDVYVRFLRDSVWSYIGKAPIDSISVPNLWPREKSFIVKLINGDIEHIGEVEQSGLFEISLLKKLPKNFVLKSAGNNQLMFFPGFYFGDNNSWSAFGVSKYEVSNSEFKKFIDEGGYDNEDYWDFPIKIDGENYTYKNTIKRFTDKFGRFGPGNWRYGQYPKGEDNFPVTNISWFEARAFAKYKGLKLPNVFQWLHTAGLSGFTADIPEVKLSNYNSNKLNEVNFSNEKKLLPNIAGNVREWVTNPHGDDKYGILGGAYMDNSYTYNSFYSLSPFDRSKGNGFRLVKQFSNDYSQDDIEISYDERDFDLEEDVSEEVFEYYKSQFDYKPFPLDVNLVKVNHENKGYVLEKFEMKPPYKADEKLYGYIAYSEKFKDKLKPVIVFPTAGGLGSINDDGFIKYYSWLNNDYGYKHLIDEGYAVIMPAYHSTYSRKRTIQTWWPNESDEYKESIIKIGKDYRRVIDYIESRKDFDFSKLSYTGFSWGSVSSNYLLAIDDRVKSATVFAGGLMLQRSKKEIEPHFYLRRIKIPILHIVGTLDGIFEYEDSFVPWNNLIGTPEKDKKIIILEGIGHALDWDIIIENQLKFLKEYN